MNKILIRSTHYKSCDPLDLSKMCALRKTLIWGSKTCKTTYFCYIYAQKIIWIWNNICCVKIIALGKNKHWNSYTEEFCTETLGARNFVYSIFVHFLLYTIFLKRDFCTRFQILTISLISYRYLSRSWENYNWQNLRCSGNLIESVTCHRPCPYGHQTARPKKLLPCYIYPVWNDTFKSQGPCVGCCYVCCYILAYV